jgi:hypothetical protein
LNKISETEDKKKKKFKKSDQKIKKKPFPGSKKLIFLVKKTHFQAQKTHFQAQKTRFQAQKIPFFYQFSAIFGQFRTPKRTFSVFCGPSRGRFSPNFRRIRRMSAARDRLELPQFSAVSADFFCVFGAKNGIYGRF